MHTRRNDHPPALRADAEPLGSGPVGEATASLSAGVRGLRIGVPRGYFFDRLEEEVATALERAIAELAQLGAEVRDVELPGVAEAVGGIFGLVLAEAQAIHAESFGTRPEDFGDDVRALLGSPGPDTAALMAGPPVGMQIAERQFDQAMLLRRVGHAYEQATDWHLRTPA